MKDSEKIIPIIFLDSARRFGNKLTRNPTYYIRNYNLNLSSKAFVLACDLLYKEGFLSDCLVGQTSDCSTLILSPSKSLNNNNDFIKPTIEELKAIFREKGHPAEAERFLGHYESNGWKVGKNPMKNWRVSVGNWLRNGKTFGGGVAVKEKREPKANPDCDACKGGGKHISGTGKCWCVS